MFIPVQNLERHKMSCCLAGVHVGVVLVSVHQSSLFGFCTLPQQNWFLAKQNYFIQQYLSRRKVHTQLFIFHISTVEIDKVLFSGCTHFKYVIATVEIGL